MSSMAHAVLLSLGGCPVRLRMNMMVKSSVNGVDFDLWSPAVCAINGCGIVMERREKIVLHGGLSKEQGQTAVLDGEMALTD